MNIQNLLLLIVDLQFVLAYYVYYTHACKQYAQDVRTKLSYRRGSAGRRSWRLSGSFKLTR